MLSFYLTLSHDCNYSEANDNQTKACATIRNAPDIPRIGTAFFFPGERTIKFAIKLLLFAIIVAISAFAAAGALAEFLHQAPA